MNDLLTKGGGGNREPHFPYVGVFQPPEPRTLKPAWFRWNHSEISSGKIILLKWPQKTHKRRFPLCHSRDKNKRNWGNTHLVVNFDPSLEDQKGATHSAQNFWRWMYRDDSNMWRWGDIFSKKNMLKIRLLEEIRLTTCHLWNRMKDGIFSVSTGAGFLPSTVSWWEDFGFGFMTLCFFVQKHHYDYESLQLWFGVSGYRSNLHNRERVVNGPIPRSDEHNISSSTEFSRRCIMKRWRYLDRSGLDAFVKKVPLSSKEVYKKIDSLGSD